MLEPLELARGVMDGRLGFAGGSEGETEIAAGAAQALVVVSDGFGYAERPVPVGEGDRTAFKILNPVSRSLTWSLWSACQMTAPRTVAPAAGSSAPCGIEMISAKPTAPGTPLIRTKTPKGCRPITSPVTSDPTGNAVTISIQFWRACSASRAPSAGQT